MERGASLQPTFLLRQGAARMQIIDDNLVARWWLLGLVATRGLPEGSIDRNRLYNVADTAHISKPQ